MLPASGREERDAVCVARDTVLTYTLNLFLEAFPLLLKGVAEPHHGFHLLLYVAKVSLSPEHLVFLL